MTFRDMMISHNLMIFLAKIGNHEAGLLNLFDKDQYLVQRSPKNPGPTK